MKLFNLLVLIKALTCFFFFFSCPLMNLNRELKVLRTPDEEVVPQAVKLE